MNKNKARLCLELAALDLIGCHRSRVVYSSPQRLSRSNFAFFDVEVTFGADARAIAA
jgi:hypothetical protein